MDRFLQGVEEFSSVEPIGSIYEKSFIKESWALDSKLVILFAYCLNFNHYHLFSNSLLVVG